MGGTAFFSSTRSSILDWDFPLQISQLVRVPPWLWTLQYQKKSHSRINKILFTCILDSMGYSLSDSILEIMRMFDGSPGFSHPFSPFFFRFFLVFSPGFFNHHNFHHEFHHISRTGCPKRPWRWAVKKRRDLSLLRRGQWARWGHLSEEINGCSGFRFFSWLVGQGHPVLKNMSSSIKGWLETQY